MASKLLWCFNLCCLIAAASAPEVPQTDTRDSDKAQILNCVRTLSSRNALGFLTLQTDPSSSAFALATGPNKALDNAHSLVIAGGRMGRGRLIGMAHDEFFYPDPKANNVSDRDIFVDNVFKWVSSSDNPRTAHVLIHPTSFRGWGNRDKLLEIFREKFENSTISSDIPALKPDVVVTHGELAGNMVSKLKSYVEQGGGLIVLSNNWWFSKDFKNQEDFEKNWSVNQLVSGAGFTYQYSKNWNYVGEFYVVNQLAVARPASEYRCEHVAKTATAPSIE